MAVRVVFFRASLGWSMLKQWFIFTMFQPCLIYVELNHWTMMCEFWCWNWSWIIKPGQWAREWRGQGMDFSWRACFFLDSMLYGFSNGFCVRFFADPKLETKTNNPPECQWKAFVLIYFLFGGFGLGTPWEFAEDAGQFQKIPQVQLLDSPPPVLLTNLFCLIPFNLSSRPPTSRCFFTLPTMMSKAPYQDVKDWYMKLENEIQESKPSHFMNCAHPGHQFSAPSLQEFAGRDSELVKAAHLGDWVPNIGWSLQTLAPFVCSTLKVIVRYRGTMSITTDGWLKNRRQELLLNTSVEIFSNDQVIFRENVALIEADRSWTFREAKMNGPWVEQNDRDVQRYRWYTCNPSVRCQSNHLQTIFETIDVIMWCPLGLEHGTGKQDPTGIFQRSLKLPKAPSYNNGNPNCRNGWTRIKTEDCFALVFIYDCAIFYHAWHFAKQRCSETWPCGSRSEAFGFSQWIVAKDDVDRLYFIQHGEAAVCVSGMCIRMWCQHVTTLLIWLLPDPVSRYIGTKAIYRLMALLWA